MSTPAQPPLQTLHNAVHVVRSPQPPTDLLPPAQRTDDEPDVDFVAEVSSELRFHTERHGSVPAVRDEPTTD